MNKNRLEAFSDGVIAVIITIMVLELKPPHGTDLAALRELVPTFLSYVLSFVYIAIYWNNHHHMLHTVHRVNGRLMWANLHLLFWLSIVPFTTSWMDETNLAPVPTALYGVSLIMAAFAWLYLQRSIICLHGTESELAEALGTDFKGKISPLLYLSGIGSAFINGWLAMAFYAAVAVLWLAPDRRIEAVLARHESQNGPGSHG